MKRSRRTRATRPSCGRRSTVSNNPWSEAQEREQQVASTHQARQSEWQRQAEQAAAAHQQKVGELEATIAEHLSRLTEVEGALRTTEELRKTVVTLETTLAAARTREHDLAAAHSRKETEWRRSLDEAIATHEKNTSELRSKIDSHEQSLAEAHAREQQVASAHQVSQSEWQRQAEQAAAAHQQQVGELLAANVEEKRSLIAEHERARAEWEREHQQARAHWDQEHQQLQAKWAGEHAAALATWNAEHDALTKHRDKLMAKITSVETERDELNSELMTVGHERLAWSARLESRRAPRPRRTPVVVVRRRHRDGARGGDGLRAATHGRCWPGPSPRQPRPDAGGGHFGAGAGAPAASRRPGGRSGPVGDLASHPEPGTHARRIAQSRHHAAHLAGAAGARVGLTSQQVEQVALTLAANRRAAMVKGGQVTIELAEVDIDEACARERMASPGPYVLLAVHAAGPEVELGIAPQLFGIPANEDTWQTAGPACRVSLPTVNEWGGCLWASHEGPDALAFEIYLPRVMAAPDDSTDGARR
jgi:hypothetical protein